MPTVVYCHDVVGGEAGYTEVQSDAGGVFYMRHFDSERIHELYLHFPPTRSIPLSGRKLQKYLKWATPGEKGRVFKLPGENEDLPELLAKTQLVFGPLAPVVSGVNQYISGPKGALKAVFDPILGAAAEGVT